MSQDGCQKCVSDENLCSLQAKEAKRWNERNDTLQLHRTAWLCRFENMLHKREAKVQNKLLGCLKLQVLKMQICRE